MPVVTPLQEPVEASFHSVAMDRIHSTFQASFNARIERLQEQETNELRTIFRYFDTDGDGAVSADQVLRIFGLLGLNINPAYVRDLEQVYLAEFLKIVDSNVPVTASTALGTAAMTPNGSAPIVPPLLATATAPATLPVDALAVPPDEAAQELANTQLWDDEWRTLDSYKRGAVSRDAFRLFLRSCFSPFPDHDLDRFLELYADSSMPEDSMVLTKASFLKFRRDYTSRERAQTEHGHSSDEDDDGENEKDRAEPLDLALVDQTLRGGAPVDGDDNNNGQALDTEAKKARVQRSNSISQVPAGRDATDGDVDGIVIDPGVVDDEFVDDDDGALVGDHGADEGGEDGAFYGDDDGDDDDDQDVDADVDDDTGANDQEL